MKMAKSPSVRHSAIALSLVISAVCLYVSWLKGFQSLPVPIRFSLATDSRLFRLKGFSEGESWGRWSIAKQASVTFFRTLPETFIVRITARGFGQSTKTPTQFTCGSTRFNVQFDSELQSQTFQCACDKCTGLEWEVSAVNSPYEMGASDDARSLGVGISSIEFLGSE